MRPGREAPEYAALTSFAFMMRLRFNEAGARGPGILVMATWDDVPHLNASMRPGREAPEYVVQPTVEMAETFSLQ